MKKGIRFSVWTMMIGVGLMVLRLGVTRIMQAFGLMFRAWVGIVFFALMALLGFVLIGGIVYTLVKLYSLPQKDRKKETIQKVLAAGSIFITLAVSVVVSVMALFGFLFVQRPEHEIEKHGREMIAYVNSFLDVKVTYHAYINFIVCGYHEIGWEWYGDGGYDPFERNPIPEPGAYIFYDTQGNVIAEK
jgi:hypothetical protein